MSIISNVNNGDSGLLSRTKINDNDNNLNADKMEKSANLSDVAAQQTALNNITDVASATNEFVLTRDTATGDALFKASAAGTNLAYTASPTDGTVTSDTGTDATIPAGSTTNASLMLPADKTKLDELALRFDATIGASGAEFTTLSAAITAGRVNILAIDDTTETTDTTHSTSFLLYIQQGVTVDMVDNQIIAGASNLTVAIEGNGTFRSAQTVLNQKTIIDAAFSGGKVIWRGPVWDNDATIAGCSLTDIQMDIDSIRAELPNFDDCGIESANNREDIIRNATFIGGGLSCSRAVRNQTGGSFHECYFESTFSTTAADPVIEMVGETGSMRGFFFNNTGNIHLSLSGICVDFKSPNGTLSLIASRTGSIFSDMILSNGDIDVQDADEMVFTNISEINSIDLSDTGSFGSKFTNCTVTSLVTCSTPQAEFLNCNLNGGMTVVADDCGITICRAGTSSGGGAETITVNASADRTRITSCRTDVAVANSGTNTSQVGNTIY